MKVYQGVPVYPGVAIGRLSVVVSDRVGAQKFVKINSAQVKGECERLELAFSNASETLRANRADAAQQLGEEYGRLYDAYLLMLNDDKLRKRIKDKIVEALCNVEYAIDSTLNKYANRLRGLNPHYAERANDVLDLKDRLLHELLAIQSGKTSETGAPTIVAGSYMNPNSVVKLDPAKTLGLVTENGAIGSHTAIVASAMRLPTVLGVGPFLAQVDASTIAIVDGSSGKLILDPDPDQLIRYQRKLDRQRADQALDQERFANRKAATSDGIEFALKCNIEFPSEAASCEKTGADGIGLYRTEFLYLTKPGALPDEEEHYNAYRQVVKAVGGKKGKQVTIRTFDLGADKMPVGLRFAPDKEDNPALGLRSLRLSLRNGEMFRTQLRAVMRANVDGNIALMFPLVTSVMEFRKAKMIFNDVRDELSEKGVPFDSRIPIGIMVETPAAVALIELFVREVDFLSIGTNDLLQYTMAADRTNPLVCETYDQLSPALLRMIKSTVDVANYYGKPVSLCGQLGSDECCLPLLLGMGLRSVSVAPGRVLRLKSVCSQYTMEECNELAKRAMQMESAGEVRLLLTNAWNVRFKKDDFFNR